MYLCLSLGFMGRYRASAGGGADIKRIREEIYAIILRQEKVAAPELAPHVKGVRAPYKPDERPRALVGCRQRGPRISSRRCLPGSQSPSTPTPTSFRRAHETSHLPRCPTSRAPDRRGTASCEAVLATA